MIEPYNKPKLEGLVQKTNKQKNKHTQNVTFLKILGPCYYYHSNITNFYDYLFIFNDSPTIQLTAAVLSATNPPPYLPLRMYNIA